MRKKVGWMLYYSIGLVLSYSRWDFQTKRFRPFPRGQKVHIEPWLYYLNIIIFFKHSINIGLKQASLSSFKPLSQDEVWTDFFEILSVNSLKGDLSNMTTVNPPLFSLVNKFIMTWFFSLHPGFMRWPLLFFFKFVYSFGLCRKRKLGTFAKWRRR